MYSKYTFSGQESTIADLVKTNSDLSKLLEFVTAAGLVDSLKQEELTVFAPNNAAFEKLGDAVKELQKEENKEKLKKILLRHVVSGKIASESIEKGVTFVNTFGKENIIVFKSKGNQVGIESSAGEAMVTKADVMASNGVVHIVDAVF